MKPISIKSTVTATLFIAVCLQNPRGSTHASKWKGLLERNRFEYKNESLEMSTNLHHQHHLMEHSPSMILCDFQFTSDHAMVNVHKLNSFCDHTSIRLKRSFNYLTVYNGSLHMNAKDYGAFLLFEVQGRCLETHEFTHIQLDIMSPYKETKVQLNIGYEIMELRGKDQVPCQGKVSRVQYGSILSISSSLTYQKVLSPVGFGNNSTRNDSHNRHRKRRQWITSLSIAPATDIELYVRRIELIRKPKCSS